MCRLALAGALTGACGLAHDMPLMPLPDEIRPASGTLAIGPAFRVAITGYRDPIVDRAVERLVSRLRAKTGLELHSIPTAGPDSALLVHCKASDPKFLSLGADESYRLEITSTQASLDANGPAGILRGLTTFAQLVQPASGGFAAPAAAIVDHPRYPWRGLMIDVSRHFMPFDALLRSLDAMEWVKLNVLHLHLTDAQAFRAESKVYPKLHQQGSDGDFYTQAEIRELIARARDRGIRVVPEIDVPGHSKSWLVGYPELGSKPGPYRLGNDGDTMDAVLNPADEAVYRFLDRLFGEMAELFPDAYFHIGADEVNGVQWQQNAAIQAFMKQHSLPDGHALLGYFTRRAFAILRNHGKIPIGWDEVLAGDPPPDVVVQAWRSSQLVAESTARGLPTLVSSGYYLDYAMPASFHYANDPTNPAAFGPSEEMLKRLAGTPLESYMPKNTALIPGSKLSDEQQKHILGGETAIWSEMVTGEMFEGRIWPRAAAIAERFWSPASVRDEASMYARLATVDCDLQLIGLQHREKSARMLHRLQPDASTVLEPLVDAIEPVKYHARLAARMRNPALGGAALNQVVDALSPESMGAVAFRSNVRKLLLGSDDFAARAVRMQLTVWRDNHALLAAIAPRSFAIREVFSVSEDLSMLSSAALEALDYLSQQKTMTPGWSVQARAVIAKHKALAAGNSDMLTSFLSPTLPPGEVMISVLSSIEDLINAAEGPGHVASAVKTIE